MEFYKMKIFYVFFAIIYKPEHMALKQLCAPAMIFMIYAFTQVIMDMANELFKTALVKLCVSIVIATTLQYLCLNGMKLVSWVFVFVPLFLMTTVTSILLFGQNSAPSNDNKKDLIDIREKYTYENLKPMADLFPGDNDDDDDDDNDDDDDDVSLDETLNETDRKNGSSENKPDIQNNGVSKDNECKYANFPDCIDEPKKMVIQFDDTENEVNYKDEHNTRMLSFLLLRTFKNYVAKIPEKDTADSIVKMIHD